MSNIIRVFHATAKPGQEGAFREFFMNEALPIVRSHDGLVAVQVGLPREEMPHDFLMVTTWRDLDTLKDFAGENWREARIEPAEAPLLAEVRVHHYVEG